MEKYQEIERSIIKKFRKDIWRKFIETITTYELIKENDKIMVCISGGKDSFLMAKCIQELQRHGKYKFDAHYVVMDPGYTDKTRNQIENLAQTLNIDIEVFKSNIFDVTEELAQDSPCYLCARMRRGYLYSKAKSLGCNKIALGHHFDDVIETTLLSMFYGSEIKTMLPKLHSENFAGLELIRPIYLVKEESIIAWQKYNNLSFINCACKFTEKCSTSNINPSKREEIKALIKDLKKINPNIDNNIMKSLDNINLNCVLGYKINKEYHSFLDKYSK